MASLNAACEYSGALATGFSLMATPQTNSGGGTRKYELNQFSYRNIIDG